MDLVAHMAGLTREAGARFLVVLIPYKGQVTREGFAEAVKTLGGRTEQFDIDEPQKRIQSALAERGIDHLDLLPAFRRAKAEGGSPYFEQDVHWTPEGHMLAAAAIHAHLEEKADDQTR